MTLLVHIETFLESVNTSACINELLLAGIERVALGANFNLNIFLCGHSFNYVATVAGNCSFYKIRMYSLFHDCHLFQIIFADDSPSITLDSSVKSHYIDLFYHIFHHMSSGTEIFFLFNLFKNFSKVTCKLNFKIFSFFMSRHF